jgi:hypothetical protein
MDSEVGRRLISFEESPPLAVHEESGVLQELDQKE